MNKYAGTLHFTEAEEGMTIQNNDGLFRIETVKLCPKHYMIGGLGYEYQSAYIVVRDLASNNKKTLKLRGFNHQCFRRVEQ